MGLKEVLSKMKIVEFETPPGGQPAPAGPAPGAPGGKAAGPVDVAAILAGIPEPRPLDDKTLARGAAPRPAAPPSGPAAGGAAAAPAGGAGGLEIPSFEEIYRTAGISEPSHGFSAYKVLEILSSPDFAGLDGKAKAAALAGFLKMNPAGPVPLADVIQDAVRRDQALDKFAELLQARLARRSEEVAGENARLQAEIDELARRHREHMEANRRALEAEQEQLAQWLTRKRIEEHKLFEAVGPFVETNPVSVDGGKAAPERPAEPGPGRGTDA
jgi:hypothetical protein